MGAAGAGIIRQFVNNERDTNLRLFSVLGETGYPKTDALSKELSVWFARHGHLGLLNYQVISSDLDMLDVIALLETYRHEPRWLIILSEEDLEREIRFMVESLGEEMDEDTYDILMDIHHGDPSALTDIPNDLLLRIIVRTAIEVSGIDTDDSPTVNVVAPDYDPDFDD